MESNKELNIDIQPPRKSKYDTVIIKPQHFAIFSSWIEKENHSHYNLRNIPYHFRLIYHSSRDGNTVEAFHKKCDNKGATIVIIKIEGSEQIIGGYSPLEWDSSCRYKETKDSFIFSFTDRKNTETAEVGYSNNVNGTSTIACYPNYGPVFGGHFSCQNDGTTWKISNH